MTKLRKQRKKKVYRYDVNRKRLKKKMNRLPKIQCDELKEEWNKKKSTKVNMEEMGLAYDPNDHIKIPSNKPESMRKDNDTVVVTKNHVIEQLESAAKARRPRAFRLPKTQADWLFKCLQKYGEDYEAMAKDRKLNIFQDTVKQLESKMKVFKSTGEQYEEYLRKSKEESS